MEKFQWNRSREKERSLPLNYLITKFMIMQEQPSSFDLIMLVDDNKINNIINRKLFELMQFSKEIVEAGNGLEALDYLKASASSPDRIPEVIFLDVYMPLLDGIGFLD